MTEPKRLSLAEFEACAADFDRRVERQSDVDRFCSRSEWILPYHRAFLPEREPFVYRGGAGEASFAVMAAREHPDVGRYLEPFENMWCFACPLVGPDAVSLLAAAIAACDAGQAPGHPGTPVVLGGIPASRDPRGLVASLARAFEDRYELRVVDATQRFVASLEGGLEGWLSRRSRSFRRNLRAALRVAEGDPLAFEHVPVPDAAAARDVYERLLGVEEKSWKHAEGGGVARGPMRAFYRDMLPRLAARRGLRVVVATREGEDVGYLHGGLVDDPSGRRHFRGLQMSYDRRFAHLSLGNLLQHEMLRALCTEGVRSYDLGTRQEYKRRWAEEGLLTLTILMRAGDLSAPASPPPGGE